MRLALDFGPLGKFHVDLPNITEEQFEYIEREFTPLINSPEMKTRDAIARAFELAVRTCPSENPSDLWHHVLYRIYCRVKVGTNPQQSWVRTSGEALEIFFANLYNPILAEHGIRLVSLISGPEKVRVLTRMGIADKVGSRKIDMSIEKKGDPRGAADGYGVIGGLHIKASLAERVSDDIPASRVMMAAGFESILITLDVKSFPPLATLGFDQNIRRLINGGELGTPERPSDKRRYIESHGDFTASFSFNSRSVPSPEQTASGRRIFVVDPSKQPDAFVQYLVDCCG